MSEGRRRRTAIARIAGTLLGGVRSGWLLAGATLVCIVLVEALSAFSLRLLGPKLNFHSGREDAPRVYREGGAQKRPVWHPYVYWRERPSEGRHVNVDERGLRRTWNRVEDGKGAARVFVLGGSTTWGPAVRDEFTIPSQLSKLLAEQTEIPVEITNFGQSAYVSTQELIGLILELQRGNVPDVVVFYDGVNDVFSSYQAGRAGIPQNEHWRRLDFESPELAFLHRIARRSSTVRLIRRLVNPRFAGGWSPSDEEALLLSDLARDTVHVYERNLEIGRALAERFGFDVFYYWQPSLWSKEPLTSYEQAHAEYIAGRFPSLDRFFRRVYELVGRNPELEGNPRFRNLSRMFDGSEGSVFWDWCHIIEDGNRRVAAEIAGDVRTAVEARAAYLGRRPGEVAADQGRQGQVQGDDEGDAQPRGPGAPHRAEQGR